MLSHPREHLPRLGGVTALGLHRRGLALLALLLVTQGCRAPSPRTSPEAQPAACETPPPPPFTHSDTLTAAVTTALEPGHLAAPANAGQRFVLDLAYETLTRVDCHNRVSPALASSWRPDGSARWIFVLNESARFWSGDRVTSRDVIASWRARALHDRSAVAAMLADSAIALDDHTLALPLTDALPRILASPSLAVYRIRPDNSWPEGTGSHALDQLSDSLLQLTDRVSGAVLRVRSVSALGARDQLDAGVDLLLADDQRVFAYAATRPEYQTAPLAWDHTWVLLLTSRSGGTPARSTADSAAALELRRALARDVVRADARAATSFSTDGLALACTEPLASALRPPDFAGAAAGTDRIVYPADDHVSRALAERLVALAAIAAESRTDTLPLHRVAPELIEPGRALLTHALSASEFRDALRARDVLAFVLAIPSTAAQGCHNEAVIPLIETRWHAMFRRTPGSARGSAPGGTRGGTRGDTRGDTRSRAPASTADNHTANGAEHRTGSNTDTRKR